MAQIQARIGPNVLFKTNKGNFNAQIIDFPVASDEFAGTQFAINYSDGEIVCSAVLTKFPDQPTQTPVISGERCNIINSDGVYFERYDQDTVIMQGNGSQYITFSAFPGIFNAHFFFIYRFLDDVWCPVSFSWNNENTLITPATSSSFGIIKSLDGSTSGTGYNVSNWAQLGEALKSGATRVTPYDSIPISTHGGNEGDYDFTSSDNIDFQALPDYSANTAGFVSLWSPTNNQLLTLAGYLWNKDLLTSEFWKKLIANPIELVFGLSIVPIDLTDYVDGTYSVVVGWIDTKILMRHLNTQWITVDCGEIELKETWGSYLDYDPFTKLEIYLPFCGIHPLKIDDFMPGKISLSYNIDLMTGSCVALVKSTKADNHGDVLDSVVYQFMGNCATQIPITAQQFADAVRSSISIAASIGSMVATGVGGASALMNSKNSSSDIGTIASVSNSIIHSGASAVENVMNIKPSIERSGAIGFSGSLLGIRTPYIILTRPRMARPDSQSSYTGYPSFITESLGDLSGLTIVQAIHLEGIPATADEINEIESLLKGGVFF